MPCSGCSAWRGVNPNFKKRKISLVSISVTLAIKTRNKASLLKLGSLHKLLKVTHDLVALVSDSSGWRVVTASWRTSLELSSLSDKSPSLYSSMLIWQLNRLSNKFRYSTCWTSSGQRKIKQFMTRLIFTFDSF